MLIPKTKFKTGFLTSIMGLRRILPYFPFFPMITDEERVTREIELLTTDPTALFFNDSDMSEFLHVSRNQSYYNSHALGWALLAYSTTGTHPPPPEIDHP